MKKNVKMWQVLGLIALAVVISVVVISVIGFASKGSFDFSDTENWAIQSPNANNLLKVDAYEVKDLNTGLGYTIDVTDDGQIKVSGTNNTEESQQIEVQDVTLAAGTYTFSSGAKGTSLSGYNMSIVIDGNTYYADFGSNTTFTLEAEATGTVYINIVAKVEVNKTFSPVLVPGEEVEDFFVIGSQK
ncbi:MAG: hypothetical protein IJ309_02425 [Clostridia bacterium]|nr:hypothetical protein [Clostridia bacterium]